MCDTYDNFSYDNSNHLLLLTSSYSNHDDIPKSLCWDYDSEDDDEIFHTLPIQTSSSSIKVYFPNEPVVNFDDIPPNQRDHSKSKSSFNYLINTLLDEDLDGTFPSSLKEYGCNEDITFILHMSDKDINELHYFDDNTVKQNISSSYKKLIILLQHIIRHRGIYYDWSVLTTDEFDSIITKHNFPTIDRSFINNNTSLNVFNEDIFTDKSSTD